MSKNDIKAFAIGAITAVVLSAAVSYGQTAMPADHQAMMMQNMQAEQQKLDDLVAKMNAATGSDKVDRIADVVNEMAAMHKRMSAMMMMHGGMPR